MKTPTARTAQSPAPGKTARPQSTQIRTAVPGYFLVALLTGLFFSALSVAVAAPAANGEGVMTVSPNFVTYGSGGNTFTFTFTANIGDFGAGSQVALTIPAGWTPPTTAAGAGHITVASGSATLSGSPPFGIAGSTITIDLASCASGHFFTVTYAGVSAPAMAGSPYAFTIQTDIGSGGEGLVNTTAAFPTVTINPFPLTVSAAGLTPDSKIYDGTTTATLTVGSPSLVGVIGSDSVSLVTAGATGDFFDQNAGTDKQVTIAGLTLAGPKAASYTLIQPTRTGNITQRTITVTAATDTKPYDGMNSATGIPTLSAGTPLAPGDIEPVWTQTFDNRNVGIGKTLTPAGAIIDGNNGLNYAYTFVPNTSGTITTMPITVTATTDSKAYDGTPNSSATPALSAGTPLAPGDSQPVWQQVFDTKNVGVGKTLTPAGAVIDGNGGLNYSYNFVPATTGTITAKPLTVTTDASTKNYGAADPTFTASYVGFVNSETPAVLGGTLAFARAPGENVGSHPVTPSGLTSGNYTIAFNSGTLSITKAALAVTADVSTKTYGAADPTFTASYVGFMNNETPAVLGGTLAFARAPGEGVGSYPVTPSGLTSGNYTIAFNSGNLSITKAALAVTTDVSTKTYGAVDPTFTASYVGFVNSETPAVLGGTLAFARAPGENVGSHPVTPSGLTSGNYTIAFHPGNLSITKATLAVTTDVSTKTYGAADPTFTASYVGFMNSETLAALSGTLAFARAPGESVGSYPVTPSGLTSGNYTITFHPANLSITAPAPTILSIKFVSPTDVMITWSAVSNGNYRIQYKVDVAATSWTDLSGDVIAGGSTASKQDIPTGSVRFYRVQVLP